MTVIDFTIYKATGHRVEYGDELGQALHDLDKANRAVEETLAMFPNRNKPTKAERTIWNSWWGPWPPKGAA